MYMYVFNVLFICELVYIFCSIRSRKETVHIDTDKNSRKIVSNHTHYLVDIMSCQILGRNSDETQITITQIPSLTRVDLILPCSINYANFFYYELGMKIGVYHVRYLGIFYVGLCAVALLCSRTSRLAHRTNSRLKAEEDQEVCCKNLANFHMF